MKAVRSGKLRHLVRIERPTDAVDEYGDPLLVWSEVATRWASVEPLSGLEEITAFSTDATITHRVKFRAGAADVIARDRLVVLSSGRVLEFVSALDQEERGRLVVALAKEVRNHG